MIEEGTKWQRPARQHCYNCGLPIFDHDPDGLCMPCSDELHAGPPQGPPDTWPRGWRIAMERGLATTFPAPRQALDINMQKLLSLGLRVHMGQLTGDGTPLTPSSVLVI